jgi:hypothetical protein
MHYFTKKDENQYPKWQFMKEDCKNKKGRYPGRHAKGPLKLVTIPGKTLLFR